jgi:hypothetical protein
LQRRGVGLVGLGQKLRHFQFELGDHFAGPLVADGTVFAGVGQNLGAVGSHGELADLKPFELLGQWQNLDEALGEEGLVFAAEGAERVVIGMCAAVSRRTGTLSWVLCSMRWRLKVPVA